jgi:uncharacterized membrane protein YeaQ/YmgE (transglycosylase-associated protein family)
MSVTQVVRSVGFSLGSALGGLVLSAYTAGSGFPEQVGYLAASIVGAVLALSAAVLVTSTPARRAAP